MLATLTMRELTGWMLFDASEPIGPRESRQQLAHLCAAISNRWRKAGTPAIEVDQFLIRLAAEVEQEKKRNLIDTLKAMARPAAERPRHRKHPKEQKRGQKAIKQQRRKSGP